MQFKVTDACKLLKYKSEKWGQVYSDQWHQNISFLKSEFSFWWATENYYSTDTSLFLSPHDPWHNTVRKCLKDICEITRHVDDLKTLEDLSRPERLPNWQVAQAFKLPVGHVQNKKAQTKMQSILLHCQHYIS